MSKTIYIHKGGKITTADTWHVFNSDEHDKQWCLVGSSFEFNVYRERGEVTAKEANEIIFQIVYERGLET